MRLNLRDMIHVPGASLPFDFRLDLSGLEFYGERPLTRPVQVSGTVRNMADALVLEGRAQTVMDVHCDRCLKPFSKQLDVPVSTLMAEELQNEENEDEIVLLENGEVDLEEVFTTAVVLSMDMQNLCSEDCKGLCSGCGVNLNEEPCRCKQEVDPRLAALAQLLDKKD
ncbi:hypothetical protein CE91St41_16870 [Oscillospiraceae bacterium]|nr:hypothetical protein CE91St40_20670 [Oscillospiraceae bacterium]BDF74798.1 hypothetical protein CE91St41_16870 [Oscillospiraceae bacterium]